VSRASLAARERTEIAQDCYELLLTELLDQKPNGELRYALLVNRGLLWVQRRDFDKAVTDLQAAIQLNQRHYEAAS